MNLLNKKKTEFIISGTRQWLIRQNSDEVSQKIHGIPFKRAETFKYLGVMLHSTLSFNEYIHCVNKKVSKILGLFARIRPFFTIEAANRMYMKYLPANINFKNAIVQVL